MTITQEQAVELAEKHGAVSGMKHITVTDGDSVVFSKEELAAMLNDYRQQAIAIREIMLEQKQNESDQRLERIDFLTECRERLEARVAELEKDAARYRFLRDEDTTKDGLILVLHIPNGPATPELWTGSQVDEAIDSAMNKEQSNEQH